MAAAAEIRNSLRKTVQPSCDYSKSCPMKRSTVHPAQVYNEKRGILFRTIHDPTKGFSAAFEYLEGYKHTLGPAGYAGLRAELTFYQRHRNDYRLTVAGDMGEHADFVGQVRDTLVRIDVTTNINYKEFRQYEPFLCEGFEYKIALFDKSNFELIDVLDLAFPYCERCGASHRFPFLLLLDESRNQHGEPTCAYDQVLIDICPNCETYVERTRYSHYFLQSIRERVHEAETFGADAPLAQKRYAHDVYAFAKKLSGSELMGLAESYYDIVDPQGGGDWITVFPFKHQIVEDRFPCRMYLDDVF